MTAKKQPILILGGGINGAAIARELLLNGQSVWLVDSADLAAGASAYSSRLIHGGLRYLEYAEFGLVRESLQERSLLLRLAPQFVHPLRIFIPLGQRWGGLFQSARRFFGLKDSKSRTASSRGLWAVGFGLGLYQFLARASTLPTKRLHQVADPSAPQVNRSLFRWLYSYWDAQILFPERFILALLEDARQLASEKEVDFRVFTYHEARLEQNKVKLVACDENQNSDNTEPLQTIQPAAIINATGAWVDQTLRVLNISNQRLMGGTKGSHFFTSNPHFRKLLSPGGIYVAATDGRPIFFLPLGEWVMVGTTDLPFQQSPETAVASEEELDYLLTAVDRVFPDLGLTRQDIDWHHSGVRPLPFSDASTPGAVTRRHRIEEHSSEDQQPPCPPLFSVIGGKLTTCRSLAEETAQMVLKRLGIHRELENSQNRLIPGAAAYPDSDAALIAEIVRLSELSGFKPAQIEAVWELCGTRTEAMLALREDAKVSDPDSKTEINQLDGTKCLTDTDLPVRFVRRVLREEWTQRLEDLVERRLMLLYDQGLTENCLRHLAELMVEEGVLTSAEAKQQIRLCKERLVVHFGRQLK